MTMHSNVRHAALPHGHTVSHRVGSAQVPEHMSPTVGDVHEAAIAARPIQPARDRASRGGIVRIIGMASRPRFAA